MTFKETIAALAQKLGVEIEVEGDACALTASAKDGTSVTVWMQGYDERGALLMGADLGAPPPERLERLYRAMLEGNGPVPRHRRRHALARPRHGARPPSALRLVRRDRRGRPRQGVRRVRRRGGGVGGTHPRAISKPF